MKESSSLMRVLFCKIQCPFICFCKPAAHLYNSSGPLKLENSPHAVVPSTATSTVCNVNSESDEKLPCPDEVKEEGGAVGVNGKQDAPAEENFVLKSCIRKQLPSSLGPENHVVEKKRVQWMDNLGQELAEIKEFESSETGDMDNEEDNSRCFCVIL